MRILKTKSFHQWAKKIRLQDSHLKQAIDEMCSEQHGANLGGHLYKKRIAMKGRGKSSGVRTIIVFKKEEKAFFVYGFSKKDRANITMKEKAVYKTLAKILLSYDEEQIAYAIKNKEIVEVL